MNVTDTFQTQNTNMFVTYYIAFYYTAKSLKCVFKECVIQLKSFKLILVISMIVSYFHLKFQRVYISLNNIIEHIFCKLSFEAVFC